MGSKRQLLQALLYEECKLTYLNFVDNKITDIAPLVRNSGLSRSYITVSGNRVYVEDGYRVYLEDNPLSRDSIIIDIPELQKRGVYVSW